MHDLPIGDVSGVEVLAHLFSTVRFVFLGRLFIVLVYVNSSYNFVGHLTERHDIRVMPVLPASVSSISLNIYCCQLCGCQTFKPEQGYTASSISQSNFSTLREEYGKLLKLQNF